MRTLLGQIASAIAVALALATIAPGVARASQADEAILSEINFARANPQAYAQRLLLQPVSDWERALGAGEASDDPSAREEAIAFLMRQPPLPALRMDDKLAAAALEHVDDQGPMGAIGHDGPAGERFDDRIRRHGVQAQIEAENIAYGPARPSDVVRELIIDSGVPSRGHRRNIFHEDLDSAGVSCGPHRDYGAMCVIDFAGGGLEAAGWRQARLDAPPAAAPTAVSPAEWVLTRGR
jgi:uncharacterized protein YkwD